jgi:hypothetical protein
MADVLFYEGDLRNALEGHATGMDKEIASAPEDHLMHVEEEEWVEALVQRYRIEAPQLLRDKWWMDTPAEIKSGRAVRGPDARDHRPQQTGVD